MQILDEGWIIFKVCNELLVSVSIVYPNNCFSRWKSDWCRSGQRSSSSFETWIIIILLNPNWIALMFCILPARDGEEEEYSSGQVLEYVHQTAQYSIFHMWVVQLIWDLRWIVSLTNWEIWQCVHIHNPTIATIIVICSYPGCWLQGTTVTTNFIFCFSFKDKRSFAVGALYSFYKATATHIKVENNELK